MHKRAEPRTSGGRGNSKRRKVSKRDLDDQENASSEEDGRESQPKEEEFVKEIRGVLDWCGRVVVPALNDSFVKR